MIDFACKKFDLEEVIKCVLGLSKSEFRLLKFLENYKKKSTTEELSKKLKLVFLRTKAKKAFIKKSSPCKIKARPDLKRIWRAQYSWDTILLLPMKKCFQALFRAP